MKIAITHSKVKRDTVLISLLFMISISYAQSLISNIRSSNIVVYELTAASDTIMQFSGEIQPSLNKNTERINLPRNGGN